MPQITVIVPVYKVEPYLHRCVDSILAQTFTDFELVLVDDGSPDNCGAICDEYAEKNKRIHVIHQQNGGLSAARNAGIDWAFANSNSEWLAFVDSDDWVHPQYLERLFCAVQRDNTKLSVCEFVPTETVTAFDEPSAETQLYDWDSLLIENNLTAIVAWNKLYAKELFNELRYPLGKTHEDEFLTYKLLHRAGRVSCLKAPLYFYFQNAEGIMNSPFSLGRLDNIDALEERIEYVRRLHKPKLLSSCVRHYFYTTLDRLTLLRTAEWIPLDVRTQKEHEVKRRFIRMLIRYGLRFAPPWREAQYYDYAFPAVNNFARKSVRRIRRLKEIGK